MPEKLLSIQETAEILNINYQLCRGLVKAGQIKSTMVGKRHKVKPEWVEQYLKRNGYEPEKVYYDRKPGRKPKVMYTTSFADVDNNVWYYRYIGFEESQNIITGYEDGTFKPENSITRAEFANMIVHFGELNTENADTSFTDINGHWAQNQIAVCFAAEYIKGYADNTFMPDNYITRAEAITIINRVLGRDDIKDFENPFSGVTDSHWAYADIMEAAVTHDAG